MGRFPFIVATDHIQVGRRTAQRRRSSWPCQGVLPRIMIHQADDLLLLDTPRADRAHGGVDECFCFSKTDLEPLAADA